MGSHLSLWRCVREPAPGCPHGQQTHCWGRGTSAVPASGDRGGCATPTSVPLLAALAGWLAHLHLPDIVSRLPDLRRGLPALEGLILESPVREHDVTRLPLGLASLELCDCSGLERLPPALLQLIRLQQLDLIDLLAGPHHGEEAGFFDALPAGLTFLGASHWGTDEEPFPLPARLSALTSLISLELYGWEPWSGHEHMPPSLTNLTVSVAFEDPGDAPPDLRHLTRLQRLVLEDFWRDEGGGLPQLPLSLTHLSAEWYGDEEVWRVPPCLSQLTNLGSLQLGGAPLDGGFEDLPRSLTYLQICSVVEGELAVPPEIGLLTRLLELDLRRWGRGPQAPRVGGLEHVPPRVAVSLPFRYL